MVPAAIFNMDERKTGVLWQRNGKTARDGI